MAGTIRDWVTANDAAFLFMVLPEEINNVSKSIPQYREYGDALLRALDDISTNPLYPPVDDAEEPPPATAVVYDWESSPAGANTYSELVTGSPTPYAPSPPLAVGVYDLRYRPRYLEDGDEVEVGAWIDIPGVAVVATADEAAGPVLILGDDSMKPMSATGSAKERTVYFDAYDDDGAPVTTLTGKAQISINGAAAVASTNNIAAAPGGGTYSLVLAAGELAARDDMVRVRPFGTATRITGGLAVTTAYSPTEAPPTVAAVAGAVAAQADIAQMIARVDVPVSEVSVDVDPTTIANAVAAHASIATPLARLNVPVSDAVTAAETAATVGNTVASRLTATRAGYLDSIPTAASAAGSVDSKLSAPIVTRLATVATTADLPESVGGLTDAEKAALARIDTGMAATRAEAGTAATNADLARLAAIAARTAAETAVEATSDVVAIAGQAHEAATGARDAAEQAATHADLAAQLALAGERLGDREGVTQARVLELPDGRTFVGAYEFSTEDAALPSATTPAEAA